MPHSREPMKHTGDTHPPEVETDTGRDDEPAQQLDAGEDRAQTGATGAAPAQREEAEPPRRSSSSDFRFDADTERYLDAARAKVRRKPLAYAAGAFAIGFLLAVITRS
jgi:hypothetical protein